MSIVDPEISGPEIAPGVVGPIFTEESLTPGGGAPGSRSLLLATLEFDSGTERLSSVEVIHPDYTYEGRVLDWGFFDRSISIPAGEYQGGDGRIRIADTDGRLRDLLSQQVVLRRKVSIRLVREGTSESAVPPFLVQEIEDFEYANAALELRTRETSFTWMDKPINGLINRTNFPDLMDGVDSAFFPILLGERTEVSASSPANPQGIVPLPRMTLTRWALSQGPMVSVGLVKKGPADGEFSIVDPADYVLTVESETIDGFTYTSLTYVDFLVDPGPGVEVRVYQYVGNYFRGDFGLVPSANSSPNALRSFIDALIVLEYIGTVREPQIPDYNTQSYLDLLNTFDTILGGSPADGYKFDYAILEPATFREEIGKLCRSGEVDRYVNREGQITVSVVLEDDPNAVILSDGPIYGEPTDNSLIIKSSVRQRSANPALTRVRYNFAKNWATGPGFLSTQYTEKVVFDDTAGQLQLAGPGAVRSGIIEGTLNMDYVADPETAAHVIGRRQDFLSLGSFRIEGECPLPEVFGLLELGQLVKVTHRWGLNVGGYREVQVKISHLVYDLARRVCRWAGVLRVPQNFGIGAALACPTEPITVGEFFSAYLWAAQNRPIAYSLTGGELPEGLTLDADTGQISGTPLYAGSYNYTITAADPAYSPALTQEISCQFDVQPTPPCGVLSGEWRHNARVGPFYGPALGEFWGVFIEDGRLVAKNATGMAAWGTVDDAQTAPASDIGSFDVQEDGNDLPVATQQLSGRVAYSRVNRSTRTWEALDKEVLASADIASGNEGCTVSIVKRFDDQSPSVSAIGILYETNAEEISGIFYRRCGYKESTDDGDTWSAEEQIGHWGEEINDTPARAIATNQGQVLFQFGNQDAPFFGHIYCQTRAADGTLSAITTVFQGGGLSQIQSGRCVGDYCGFEV